MYCPDICAKIGTYLLFMKNPSIFYLKLLSCFPGMVCLNSKHSERRKLWIITEYPFLTEEVGGGEGIGWGGGDYYFRLLRNTK